MMKAVGYDMSKYAAEQAFKQAKLTPRDVQVVELHDCFSGMYMILLDQLLLCL